MPKSSRLSDTAALVHASDKSTTSVSIRDVENGHMICKSSDGPAGYEYKEEFVTERPTISVHRAAADRRILGNSLSEAVAHVNRPAPRTGRRS